MSTLAIKGHPTRGSEVIALLRMLGGTNFKGFSGLDETEFYGIEDGGITQLCDWNNCVCFTLEEFEEKFPYKIGDKVKNARINDFIGKIINVQWDNSEKQIIYTVEWNDATKSILNYFARDLQPYKEQETMEKVNYCQMGKITAVCIENTNYEDKVEIMLDNYEIIEENGKYYAIKKKPKYPKIYEECCEIMGISYSYIGGTKGGLSASTYRIEEVRALIYLLICRDAYWKIAGDWKPDCMYADLYCIGYDGFVITFNMQGGHHLLSFPTAEMRDAFYKNFKDLIEQCKELL